MIASTSGPRPLPWPSVPSSGGPPLPARSGPVDRVVDARARGVPMGPSGEGPHASGPSLLDRIEQAAAEANEEFRAHIPTTAEARRLVIRDNLPRAAELAADGVELDPADLWNPQGTFEAALADGNSRKKYRGNPFIPGTESWETFARHTGVWTTAQKWPSVLEGDYTQFADAIPDFKDGYRNALEAIGHGHARVSVLMAQAAAAGAEDTQLKELRDVWRQMDDVTAKGWDNVASGFADGEFEWGLGTVSTMLRGPGALVTELNNHAEYSALKLQVDAATGRTMDKLRDALQRLDVDVHGGEAERAEQVARKLMGLMSELLPEMAALRRAGRGDEVDRALERVRQLMKGEDLP